MKPAKTALLVIDMQNGFCSPRGSLARIGVNVSAFAAVVAEVSLLVAAARERAATIIFTQHCYARGYPNPGIEIRRLHPRLPWVDGLLAGTWDSDIVDELTPQSGERVMQKSRYDAFIGNDLETVLRRASITNVVLSGVATNSCVESTARTAAQLDFDVAVASDATAATSAEWHRCALRAIEYGFGSVMPWRKIFAIPGAGSGGGTR